MDKFTKKKRSEIMSKIRSRDTQVEKLVFRELGRHGIYFQKYYKRAIGNPDLALPKKKKAVFIDGDFWHGYQFAKLKKRLPKEYWLKKIKKNDRKVYSILKISPPQKISPAQARARRKGGSRGEFRHARAFRR